MDTLKQDEYGNKDNSAQSAGPVGPASLTTTNIPSSQATIKLDIGNLPSQDNFSVGDISQENESSCKALDSRKLDRKNALQCLVSETASNSSEQDTTNSAGHLSAARRDESSSYFSVDQCSLESLASDSTGNSEDDPNMKGYTIKNKQHKQLVEENEQEKAPKEDTHSDTYIFSSHDPVFSEGLLDGSSKNSKLDIRVITNTNNLGRRTRRTLSVVSMCSVHGRTKNVRRFSRKQKLTLFCLCLVNFSSYLSMSVIAPFYPAEASNKGMREAISGFVFSVYALAMMVSSPIFGKVLPHVGAKFLFYNGIVYAGVANIIFGLLDMCKDTLTFTLLSFLVRIFEAIGAAAFATASYAIILHLYPDDISTVFGFIETCIGVGMSVGPALGGALYGAGGFGLPFYILGSFVLLTLPISWYIMRDLEVSPTVRNPGSYLKLLRVPEVLVISLILVVGSQSLGFVEPTLEPHMRKEFGLSPELIGVLFLLMSASFSICSPIIGWLSGKMEQRIPLMVSGLLIMAVSQVFMGPSPMFNIDSNVWITMVTIIFVGIAFAIAYVPTMECIIIAAVDGGLRDDIGTYSLVSGLWNSMYSLGEVIGPSVGGVLLDLYGFQWASTIMGALSFITAIIAIVYWALYKSQNSSDSKTPVDSGIGDLSVESEPPNEASPLLGSGTAWRHNSM